MKREIPSGCGRRPRGRLPLLLNDALDACLQNAGQKADRVAGGERHRKSRESADLASAYNLSGKLPLVDHSPSPICSMAVCLAALRSRARRMPASSSGSWAATV